MDKYLVNDVVSVFFQLTAKNIQCMRAILSLAHCYGDVLGSAWYTILNTLQHLTVMLGLKFSSSGSVKAIQVNELPTLVCLHTFIDWISFALVSYQSLNCLLTVLNI